MIQGLFGHSDCSYYDCVGNGPGTLKHLLLVMKWMLSNRLVLRCKTRTKCSNCWQYVCGHLERRAKEFLELMLNNFSIAGIWSVWFVSDPCLHRLPSLQTLSVPLELLFRTLAITVTVAAIIVGGTLTFLGSIQIITIKLYMQLHEYLWCILCNHTGL